MNMHRKIIMNRTQIYLNPEQQKALKAMAARTGRTQSELIRDAIDRFVGQRKATERATVIKRSAGLWKGREDLPDLAAIRREANRVSMRS
jgi:predicted transcriptional regulator